MPHPEREGFLKNERPGHPVQPSPSGSVEDALFTAFEFGRAFPFLFQLGVFHHRKGPFDFSDRSRVFLSSLSEKPPSPTPGAS